MNTYIDSTVRAEIDRRYELAGVDPSDRHAHHRSELSRRPLGAHPLRPSSPDSVGGRQGSASPHGPPAAHRGAVRHPRHP